MKMVLADPSIDELGPDGAVSTGPHDHLAQNARRIRPLPRSILAGIGLFICTGGPSTFLILHVFKNSTWPTLYLFSPVAITGAILLYRQVATVGFRKLPFPIYPVAGFCVLALLSGLWTVSPSVTPTAALIGLGVAAFGCWFGWSLSVREHIAALVTATTLAIVPSLVVIVLRPDIGHAVSVTSTTGYGPDWMGIYGNRNSLAAISALGVLAFVGFVAIEPTARRAAIGVIGAAVQMVTLIFSGGDTSLIALTLCAAAAVLLIPCLWGLKRVGVPGAAVVVAGVAVIAVGWHLVFANIGTLTSAAGRSPMLSSRRVIWEDVRGFIRARPYLGYGYWGFWDRADLTADTYARVGAGYGSAHDSALEVLLMMGVVGLVLYLQVCAQSIAGILRLVWLKRCVASWWWTMLIVYLIVQNLTESFVLWHSYNWVLLVAAGFVAFGPSTTSPSLDERLGLEARGAGTDGMPTDEST